MWYPLGLVNYGSERSNIDLTDAQDTYTIQKKQKLNLLSKSKLQAKGVQFIHLDVPADQTSKVFSGESSETIC